MSGNIRRHALSDDEWLILEPLLPRRRGPGRPPKDHRLMIDGILWVLRTGAPWRDLPERFGPWKTVYERFRLWTRRGIWQSILLSLKAYANERHLIDWRLFAVDTTIVRAHKAAAGAKKNPPPCEPQDHALGRSRGGFTTKLHLVTDATGLPITAELMPGQAHEARRAIAFLSTIRVPTRGRPRQRPEAISGDKAYSASHIRKWLKLKRIRDVIPTREDEARATSFDRKAYRQRHIIECSIGHLKEGRRVATRYEKLALHYLGMVTVGMIRVYLRRLADTFGRASRRPQRGHPSRDRWWQRPLCQAA